VSVFLGLRALIRVLGRINQTHVKKIIAYSSIFITAWLLSCERATGVRFEYLTAYRVGLRVMILAATSFATAEVRELFASARGVAGLTLGGSLLSLGGCPPFIGFYAKITVICTILQRDQSLWSRGLVLSSVFLLYLYMRLFYFTLNFRHRRFRGTSLFRVSGLAGVLLWGVLLVPIFLCLGVRHRKF